MSRAPGDEAGATKSKKVDKRTRAILAVGEYVGTGQTVNSIGMQHMALHVACASKAMLVQCVMLRHGRVTVLRLPPEHMYLPALAGSLSLSLSLSLPLSISLSLSLSLSLHHCWLREHLVGVVP